MSFGRACVKRMKHCDDISALSRELDIDRYIDLEHLRSNIEAFIDAYYNRCRLHSALGARKRAGSANSEERLDKTFLTQLHSPAV